MSDTENTGTVVVDGKEALAYVIVRPNEDFTGVILEAAANGITKGEGAFILRHIADRWAAEQAQEDAKTSSGAGIPSEHPEDLTDK